MLLLHGHPQTQVMWHKVAPQLAGRRRELPLRILWGAEGTVGRCSDPLAEWCQVATQVSGRVLPGGHYLAEELPDRVADWALASFG